MSVGRARLVSVVAIAVIPAWAVTMSAGQQTGPAAPGNGTIAGIVLAAPDNEPVPGAAVIVRNAESNWAATHLSDAEGRFRFDGLPGGRYLVRASKLGFVDTEYGATALGKRGTPLPVREGVTGGDVVLRMAKGAVIEGAVFDASGAPAIEQTVGLVASRRTLTGWTMTPVTARSAVMGRQGPMTDDRGRYRLWGIAPGTYLVAVNWQAPQTVPVPRTTEALVQLAERLIANPRMPHPPQAMTVPLFGGIGVSESESEALKAPVYYPAAVSSALAVPITVTAGEERRGVDITLRPVRAGRIDVTIAVDGEATPPQVTLQLLPVAPTVGARRPATLSRDGRAEIAGVLPGVYELEARTNIGGSAADTVWGRATIEVAGDDVVTRHLSLGRAGVVSGRVTMLTGTDAASPAQVIVGLDPVPRGDGSWLTPLRAIVKDGAFRFDAVPPGQYRVAAQTPGVAGSGVTWHTVAVRRADREVTHTPLDVGVAADVGDLTIVLSSQLANLDGRLESGEGQGVTAYYVVLFARDREAWYPSSPRLLVQRPGEDGTFHFTSVPPGDYWLAISTEAAEDSWFEPGALEQAAAASLAITLDAGARVFQGVKVR